MERVETLAKKLLEQLDQHTPIDQLMMTVQMLQSELVHLKSTNSASAQTGISASVHIPVSPEPKIPATVSMVEEPQLQAPAKEEKTILVLEVNEEEIEAELEEIKRNAKAKEQISVQNKPQLLFDPVEDIPTLTHQAPRENAVKKELNEQIGETAGSLNEKLRQAKIELSETLQDVPVKDLKKAIGLNDRFLFIKELFRGDETMYERSIKTINGFGIYGEAEFWIKRELKLKLGWDDKSPTVKQFDQLVRRRFL
jgi:hypothetical protein